MNKDKVPIDSKTSRLPLKNNTRLYRVSYITCSPRIISEVCVLQKIFYTEIPQYRKKHMMLKRLFKITYFFFMNYQDNLEFL